ncbi:UbiA prenyltransferase [Candidatus Magnetoovum chiemensis]|nr:UbiA prenyltransferase [Candidatus Magnetoovum chiemensis]
MLNGGTLAFNSAFDNDVSDVGYLDNPPPVPARLTAYSLVLMVIGGAGAFFISVNYAAAYWISFIMSVLYSCPPVRLKARAGYDILINVVGYGALTTYAGWACVSDRLDLFIVLICVGYMFLFASLYPLTQIYQYEEDLAKNDKTFSIALGPLWSLRFAFLMMLCAFAVFFYVSLVNDGTAYLFIPPLILWLTVLAPWLILGRAYAEKKGMYRALWAWAFTDIAMVLAFNYNML